MRHRKQSDRTTLARAGVLGATMIAAGVLGTGTAVAQGDQSVVDVDDVIDVDYVEDPDVLDFDGLDAHDTIDVLDFDRIGG